MEWAQIRAQYPNQWVIVEADHWIESAHGRTLTFWVVAVHPNARPLLQCYLRITKRYPQRDFFLAHTTSPTLQIRSSAS